MDEKKLTDEEIVKALECCTVDEVTDCENCPLLRESCAIIRKYALDLIHRLQAKIERLTKKDNEKNERSPFLMCEDYDAYLESMSKTELLEYFHFVMGNYKHSLDKVTLENIELQKQVDELKEKQVIECHGMLEGCDLVMQAVKDTAKEILQEVLSLCKKAEEKLSIMFANKQSGYGEGYKNSVAHFNKCILKLAEEKGVEVE